MAAALPWQRYCRLRRAPRRTRNGSVILAGRQAHERPGPGPRAAELVGRVRASVLRTASVSLEELERDLSEPIVSISLRAWPSDFPTGNAKEVEHEAIGLLGERGGEILHSPRTTLGPPWTKDHRIAFAATIIAAST